MAYPVRVVTTYERITRTASKTVLCTVCGRKLRRQRTFGQTLNPFNKNPDGTLKDRVDIGRALALEVEGWRDTPETHDGCAS